MIHSEHIIIYIHHFTDKAMCFPRVKLYDNDIFTG